MELTPAIVKAFAPSGALRASINVGNPILARMDTETGQAVGVSVDLAQAFADRLGIPLELKVFKTANESVTAVRSSEADIGFFAIDPARGEGIRFTPPYVLIEGAYLVRDASPLRSNDEVDRSGVRVMVGQGSAYDLFLSRHLTEATIVRAPSSPAVVPTFLEQGTEVAAGVKQQLEGDASRLGGLRLLPGSFMVIRQAMGTSADRGEAAAQALSEFVEESKRSGMVAEALLRHGIQGVSVAPAAN